MYPMKYFLNPDYAPFEVLGVEGLFSNLRVDANSLPEGFHVYSFREGDDGEPFASIARNVWVNHTGDFICKGYFKEVEENGEVDLDGDFSFLDSDMTPEQFFGVSFKEKLAEAVDAFCFDHDWYEYIDNAPPPVENPREAMLAEILSQLDDKDSVEAMKKYIQSIRDESIDREDEAREYAYATDLIDALDDRSRELDRKPSLDSRIAEANEIMRESDRTVSGRDFNEPDRS